MTREAATEAMPIRQQQTSRRKRSSVQKPTATGSGDAACSACMSSSLGANIGRRQSATQSSREWSRADTEYYRMLADRYRDSLRQSRERDESESAANAKAPSVDAADTAAAPLPSLQDSLNMRVPRPRSDRASNFIRQCDLVPLDPTMQPQLSRRRRHCDNLNGDGDEEDTDAGAASSAGDTVQSGHGLDLEQVERSQALLLDQFHEWHRCCNVFHVMAYHPDYLAIFLHFHNNLLLQGNGPIGVAERHYLAIMAAARHRCSYLVHLHAIEFLHLRGDPAWLRGLAHASPKMRKLGPLCRLLAHRPWDITPAVLRSLLSGPDSYSQSEFVHALCLLSHFVALSGFVAGTGIRPEFDFPHGHTYRFDSSGSERFGLHAGGSTNGSCGVPSSPAPSSPGADPKQRVLDLMEAMKSIDGLAESGLPEDQLLERFETMEEETAGIRFHKAASKEQLSSGDSSVEQVCAELVNFCDDPSFEYKDFHQAKQDTKCRSFRIQDYSWEEDGSCLIDRFLPNFGTELDRRFQACFGLTYDTMGANRDVETTPFRRAIWYYILSIFGLRHDDYDYNLINKLLNIDLKKYCKLVACCPDQVTKAHYKSAMPGFRQSEKVHVNLVIMDSRMQASLLYGLRALNNHMTEQQ